MVDTVRRSDQVAKICEPLFFNCYIKTFYYARIYDAGHCFMLCTNSHWLSYKKDHDFTVLAPIFWQKDAVKLYHLVPQHGDELHTKIISDGASIFGIHHPFDLIYRRQNYYELYSYALQYADRDAPNFYFNNLALLERFSLYFNEKADSIIRKHEQRNDFYVPNRDLVPINYSISKNENLVDDLKIERLNINGAYGNIKLSHRETECLIKISEGYSYKKIAQLLGDLSPRTIETYINSIKTKTGCNDKSELIALANQVIPYH